MTAYRNFFRKGKYSLLLLAGIWIGCQQGAKAPDVSDIDLRVSVARFEQDLFRLDTAQLDAGIADLRARYGEFLDEVFVRIMSDPQHPDASADELIGQIVRSPQLRWLNDTCQVVYGDLSGIEQELTLAMKYFRHYLPERPVPQFVSYISEYSLGTFTYGDSLAGIGLDFFLGSDFPRYDVNVFPAYIQRTMNREYMVPKVVEAIASNLTGNPTGNRLLDFMIANGKILYLKDILLPHVSDSIKLEYTSAQVDWVNSNERDIWTFFLSENLLYSTKMQEIQKLIAPSPVAPGGMPREAPGRIGNWVGWQIVKAYMRKHPQTTIAALLSLQDAQQLLEKSNYKPRR